MEGVSAVGETLRQLRGRHRNNGPVGPGPAAYLESTSNVGLSIGCHQ